jgi:hypothetical protein
VLLQINAPWPAVDKLKTLRNGAHPTRGVDTQREGAMKHTMSGPSAVLCAAVISAAFVLGASGVQAKGGSPSWHGLTYHGAMLDTRGAYACDASGRTHLARPAIRICRISH